MALPIIIFTGISEDFPVISKIFSLDSAEVASSQKLDLGEYGSFTLSPRQASQGVELRGERLRELSNRGTTIGDLINTAAREQMGHDILRFGLPTIIDAFS